MTGFIGALLCFVFISSAFSKLMNVRNFELELISYGMPYKLRSYLAWAVLLFEGGLGAAFLFPSSLLLWKQGVGSAFIVLLTVMTVRKNGLKSKTCSCFGANHPLSRFPVQRNAAIVIVMLADSLLPRSSNYGGFVWLWLLLVLAATLLLENMKLRFELTKGGE